MGTGQTGKTGRMVVKWQLNGWKHAIPLEGSTSWSRMSKTQNTEADGQEKKQANKQYRRMCVALKKNKKRKITKTGNKKHKTERTKLRQSGWVRYGEIDVLSLHLQPQKCQGCGELQWSESSSALLQPRLKHTYRV